MTLTVPQQQHAATTARATEKVVEEVQEGLQEIEDE